MPYTTTSSFGYVNEEVEFIYHSDKSVTVSIVPCISSYTWSIWGGGGDLKTIFVDEFRIILKFPSPGYYTVGKAKDGSNKNATIHIKERPTRTIIEHPPYPSRK